LELSGANSFARSGPKKLLEWHPTVKPIALVADAIRHLFRLTAETFDK
jgi:hypothetical protein